MEIGGDSVGIYLGKLCEIKWTTVQVLWIVTLCVSCVVLCLDGYLDW